MLEMVNEHSKIATSNQISERLIVEKKSMGGEPGLWPLVRSRRQFENLKMS